MSTGLGIPAELVPSLGDSPPDVVSSEATACPVLQAATTKWFGRPVQSRASAIFPGAIIASHGFSLTPGYPSSTGPGHP